MSVRVLYHVIKVVAEEIWTARADYMEQRGVKYDTM